METCTHDSTAFIIKSDPLFSGDSDDFSFDEIDKILSQPSPPLSFDLSACTPVLDCEDLPVSFVPFQKPLTLSPVTMSIQKKTKTKKKTTQKGSISGVVSVLNFPRSKLLKMTTDELDAHVKSVELTRNLTKEEQELVKKQRRMIKNRESASASRVRKKNQMQVMENELNRINEENQKLRQEIVQLRRENFALQKSQASFGREISPLQTTASPKVTTFAETSSVSNEQESLSNGFSFSMNNFWTVGPVGNNFGRSSIETSTSLFVFILAFGILFSHFGGEVSPSFEIPSNSEINVFSPTTMRGTTIVSLPKNSVQRNLCNLSDGQSSYSPTFNQTNNPVYQANQTLSLHRTTVTLVK